MLLQVDQIARVCHEANRAYCMTIGDHSQPTWDMAPAWQKSSFVAGVEAALLDPDKTPEDSHVGWLEGKKKAGWKYGPKKAPEKLEHPCMLPYDELSLEQKAKDELFLAVVKSLSHMAVVATTPRLNVPVPEGEGQMVHDRPEDSTLETGVLDRDGSIVKGGTVETEVTGGKRKRRGSKGADAK